MSDSHQNTNGHLPTDLIQNLTEALSSDCSDPNEIDTWVFETDNETIVLEDLEHQDFVVDDEGRWYFTLNKKATPESSPKKQEDLQTLMQNQPVQHGRVGPQPSTSARPPPANNRTPKQEEKKKLLRFPILTKTNASAPPKAPDNIDDELITNACVVQKLNEIADVLPAAEANQVRQGARNLIGNQTPLQVHRGRPPQSNPSPMQPQQQSTSSSQTPQPQLQRARPQQPATSSVQPQQTGVNLSEFLLSQGLDFPDAHVDISVEKITPHQLINFQGQSILFTQQRPPVPRPNSPRASPARQVRPPRAQQPKIRQATPRVPKAPKKTTSRSTQQVFFIHNQANDVSFGESITLHYEQEESPLHQFQSPATPASQRMPAGKPAANRTNVQSPRQQSPHPDDGSSSVTFHVSQPIKTQGAQQTQSPQQNHQGLQQAQQMLQKQLLNRQAVRQAEQHALVQTIRPQQSPSRPLNKNQDLLMIQMPSQVEQTQSPQHKDQQIYLHIRQQTPQPRMRQPTPPQQGQHQLQVRPQQAFQQQMQVVRQQSPQVQQQQPIRQQPPQVQQQQVQLQQPIRQQPPQVQQQQVQQPIRQQSPQGQQQLQHLIRQQSPVVQQQQVIRQQSPQVQQQVRQQEPVQQQQQQQVRQQEPVQQQQQQQVRQQEPVQQQQQQQVRQQALVQQQQPNHQPQPIRQQLPVRQPVQQTNQQQTPQVQQQPQTKMVPVQQTGQMIQAGSNQIFLQNIPTSMQNQRFPHQIQTQRVFLTTASQRVQPVQKTPEPPRQVQLFLQQRTHQSPSTPGPNGSPQHPKSTSPAPAPRPQQSGTPRPPGSASPQTQSQTPPPFSSPRILGPRGAVPPRPAGPANTLNGQNLLRSPLTSYGSLIRQPIPDQPPPPPAFIKADKVPDGFSALCPRCGISNDFFFCHRCRVRLAKDVKLFKSTPIPEKPRPPSPVVKPVIPVAKSTSSPVIPKPKPTITYITTASLERKKETKEKRDKLKEKKKKDLDEAVIDLLSSDDEESSSTAASDSQPKDSKGERVPSSQGICRKEPTYSVQEMAPSRPEPEPRLPDEPEEADGSFTSMYMREVRIGNHVSEFRDRLVMSGQGIAFTAFRIDGEVVRVFIPRASLKAVLVHYADPTFLIFPSRPTATRIRIKLGLTDEAKHYYDPCSNVQAFKRILLTVEKITGENKAVLNDLLKGILTEIDADEMAGIASKTLLPIPTPPATRSILQFENMRIHNTDYACLAEEKYLNDVIIDFYLLYLLRVKLSKADAERTHIFSTFFYNRLTKPHPGEACSKDSPAEKRHKRVRTWTKKIDLFKKDFIIIPINENSHWFLAVICFPHLLCPVQFEDNIPVSEEQEPSTPSTRHNSLNLTHYEFENGEERDEAEPEDDLSDGDPEDDIIPPTPPPSVQGQKPLKQPCILIFDSLRGSNPRARVVATLRDYLKVEYKWKTNLDRQFTKDNFRGAVLKVPQQDNFYDCGLFVLQYVESFFESPLTDYRLPIKYLGEWFSPETMRSKRQDVGNIIQELMVQQGVDPSTMNLPDLAHFATEFEEERESEAQEELEDEEEEEMEPDETWEEEEEHYGDGHEEYSYEVEGMQGDVGNFGDCGVEDQGEGEEGDMLMDVDGSFADAQEEEEEEDEEPIHQATWAAADLTDVQQLLQTRTPADAPTRQSLKSVRINRKQQTDEEPQTKRSKP